MGICAYIGGAGAQAGARLRTRAQAGCRCAADGGDRGKKARGQVRLYAWAQGAERPG